jgi:hypothetical protein
LWWWYINTKLHTYIMRFWFKFEKK